MQIPAPSKFNAMPKIVSIIVLFFKFDDKITTSNSQNMGVNSKFIYYRSSRTSAQLTQRLLHGIRDVVPVIVRCLPRLLCIVVDGIHSDTIVLFLRRKSFLLTVLNDFAMPSYIKRIISNHSIVHIHGFNYLTATNIVDNRIITYTYSDMPLTAA